MSETVHYTGVLVPLCEPGAYEEAAKVLLIAKSIPFPLEGTSFVEELQEATSYHKYLVINEVLYEVRNFVDHDIDEDIDKVILNEDKTVSFEVRYYNGGAGFQEVLEKAFKKSTNKS